MASTYPRYPVGHKVVIRAPIAIEPTSHLVNTAVAERGVFRVRISHTVIREKDAGRRELISEPDGLWKGCVEVEFDREGVPSLIKVWKT